LAFLDVDFGAAFSLDGVALALDGVALALDGVALALDGVALAFFAGAAFEAAATFKMIPLQTSAC